MSIQFPIRAERNPGAQYAHIVDSSGRVLFGGGSLEDAEQLVAAANAGAKIQSQPLAKQPRRKNRRQQIAEDLRESDPIATIMERSEIVYGPHDDLPQAGDLVARLGSKAR